MNHITDDEIEAWQANPVTVALKGIVQSEIQQRITAITAAYLAGNPVPEVERKAINLAKVYFDGMFEVDKADDVKAAMERYTDE